MNLSIGTAAQLACIWEVTARKPGNVHPESDADRGMYVDFLASAAAIAPVMDRSSNTRPGQTILSAVEASRRVVAHNTNLGTVLLLAPMAAVRTTSDFASGIADVIAHADVEDSRLAYRAIRLAQPAGLGYVAAQDVSEEPSQPLLAVMKLAADRDLVARQYANGFAEILDIGIPILQRGMELGLEKAIIMLYLEFMARFPDSLIARKRGDHEAHEAARRAGAVLACTPSMWDRELAALDRWLRELGNARSPGTSADLVAATLFAALRLGILEPPCRWSVAE